MIKKGADLPVLVGQAGPLNGQRWSISSSLTIGRDGGCDVVIPDRQVSRYHARISQRADGILLEDLGSKNGTYYEGEKVEEPVFIQDGGLLQVALVQNFVYLSSDATLPLGPGINTGVDGTGGLIYLDPRSRRVWVRSEELVPPLSGPQFRLLQCLYDQQGKVVSRDELVKAIWGEDESQGVSEEAMDALVRRLRDRLALMATKHAFILTIRGHGLRLDNFGE
jgi:hypothetical protein